MKPPDFLRSPFSHLIKPLRRFLILATLICVATDVRSQPVEAAVPATREQLQLSFAGVVKKAAPAVTNIFAQRVVRSQMRTPLFDDPLMRRFFGDQPGRFMQRERVQRTLGSGVIVRSDGIIVTNNHVIENATGIKVVLNDRREFDAEVLLTDPHTDLAILKIHAGREPLPVLEFADSDNAQVGDLVLAIGNPFGVGQTVTSGIVSAAARTQGGVSDYQFFIQTDAAINPGNSGGALVGVDGKLLGINTAIYSRSGGSIGIGFAIPSVMVRQVVENAFSGKPVARPWLGASGQPVTQDISQNLGLDRPGGVLIRNIYPGGPADLAGLKIGDAILKINGREVPDPETLRYRIATGRVGDNATIEVWRNGAITKLTLQLKPAPEIPPRNITKLSGDHPLTGVVIANLSPAYTEELGLSPGLVGVIISEIPGNSPAAQIGLEPGDIILAIGRDKTKLVEDVVRLTRKARPVWELRIRRGDQVLSVRIGA